ncbi:uncharacterized protein LOC105395568 [Plutella xylostella]|uniref:uncharacterized protein LOC105395568 n=1 Tax=Plutella xylostella TaxID=51655 RepID=UPI0020329D8E|nr:uncharacterized protein LOC105395568 [Plutella xylostella]
MKRKSSHSTKKFGRTILAIEAVSQTDIVLTDTPIWTISKTEVRRSTTSVSRMSLKQKRSRGLCVVQGSQVEDLDLTGPDNSKLDGTDIAADGRQRSSRPAGHKALNVEEIPVQPEPQETLQVKETTPVPGAVVDVDEKKRSKHKRHSGKHGGGKSSVSGSSSSSSTCSRLCAVPPLCYAECAKDAPRKRQDGCLRCWLGCLSCCVFCYDLLLFTCCYRLCGVTEGPPPYQQGCGGPGYGY